MVNLTWAIVTIKQCFVAPNIINPKLLNDDFSFSVAMTQIAMAIKSGEITKEEFEKQILDKKFVQ